MLRSRAAVGSGRRQPVNTIQKPHLSRDADAVTNEQIRAMWLRLHGQERPKRLVYEHALTWRGDGGLVAS